MATNNSRSLPKSQEGTDELLKETVYGPTPPENQAELDDGSTVAASARAFGKMVKPKLSDSETATLPNRVYDPHTGLYVDAATGMISSRETAPDNTSMEKHARARELQEKLSDPSCDHSRLSARIEIHGSASSPYADSDRLNLNRVVTSGLTKTADVSFRDMAACAFGTVDSHCKPIAATTVETEITELPTTATLLRRTHIIPDIINSLVETGITMEIQFGHVQIFNGVIVDRRIMDKAPQVKLLKKTGFSEDENFILLLIELSSSSDYLQWMVQRVHKTDVNSGSITICAGIQDVQLKQMPSAVDGRHKHVFLLLNQKAEVYIQAGVSRWNFDVHAFSSRYELGTPIAATYFESEIV